MLISLPVFRIDCALFSPLYYIAVIYDVILQLINVYVEIVKFMQVCRDSETGVSRGCGYVTMISVPEARTAITALDGSVCLY